MQVTPGTKRGLKRIGTLLGVVIVGSAIFSLLIVALAPVATQVKASGEFWLDEKSDPLVLPPLSEPSLVYAADGTFLARFKAEVDREPVTLDRIPIHVRQAFMAAEDDTFYEHMGIDAKSIGRALLSNFEAGGISQGGSTITQQVIKNAYFIEEESGVARQTIDRKAREAFMALRLERHLNKDQILERYLNSVYIGGGAYGVQAASRRYFNKGADDLLVWEAALLAGMVASPSRFDPVIHPEASLERRSWVMGRLYDLGWIDKATYDLGMGQPLPGQRFEMSDNTESEYFVEAVKQEL
ncbi:MAG: penicillin-binding protein, partial [Actinobacteria bacterium ATB1]|nr:penicillin-binding protein [Actinobacteria bacterium ATB1]